VRNQHGLNRKRSTFTLSAELQSVIGRALVENEYLLMVSLDLSSAFDIINTNLLMQRLKIIGLPTDILNLIEVWLHNRSSYVCTNGENSYIYYSYLGQYKAQS
jgi:hypothetical protein